MILAITAATVVSYYLFIHDLSVLLIPAVVTLNRFVQAEETGDIFGWVVAGTSALVLLAPTSVFLIPNHFYLLSILISRVPVSSHASFRVPRMPGSTSDGAGKNMSAGELKKVR